MEGDTATMMMAIVLLCGARALVLMHGQSLLSGEHVRACICDWKV